VTRNDAVRVIKKYGKQFILDENQVARKNRSVFDKKEDRERLVEQLREFRRAIGSIEVPETKKPCPGCGGDHRRDEDRVCRECRRRIEEYPKLLKAASKLKEGLIPVAVPPIDGEQLQYFEGNIPATTKHFVKTGRQRSTGDGYIMGDAFATIINYLGETLPIDGIENAHGRIQWIPSSWQRREHRYLRHDTVIRAIPEAAAVAVEQLDQNIRAALTEAYRRGVVRGQSILVGLASGDLSITEMQEKVLNLTSRHDGDDYGD